MTAKAMYDLINYVISKNQNGYYPPDSFNLTINVAQKSYADFLIGSLQTFQPGRPIARVTLGQNANVYARLSPFVVPGFALSLNTATGVAPYPGDFLWFEAMSTLNGRRIKQIEPNRISSHLNSVIDPTATNPYFYLINTGFAFQPNDIAAPRLTYIKIPPDIKYAYTLDSNQRQVYDSASSVDPLWREVDCLEIIVRALAQVGINLQSNAVEQYAMNIKNNGQ